MAQVGYDYLSHTIPGTIQLEEYDLGGNGIAYLDNIPGSAVTPVVNYRTDEDVDIETCTDAGGGYNVGYTTAGEWLEYSVNVSKTAKYNLMLRVACNGDARTVSMTMYDKAFASSIAIPNTAGWQTWQTVTIKDLQMTAGEHVLRLTIGTTDYINLNYMSFEEIIVAVPPVITLTSPLNQATFAKDKTVVMSATASDPDGNIIGVSFYEGTNLLTTVNTAPFTYNWSGRSPGTYSISAEAFDTDGLSTKTSSVTITIQNVVTGMEDNIETTELKVFPNPTQNLIQWSKPENWVLMNAQGQELNSGNGIETDLQTYPSGLYFLKIGSKIVKVRKE